MPKDFSYKELGVLEADELVEALNFPNGQLVCRSSSREKYSLLGVFKSTRAWFEGSYHRTAIIWLMRVPRPCSKSKGSKMIPLFRTFVASYGVPTALMPSELIQPWKALTAALNPILTAR